MGATKEWGEVLFAAILWGGGMLLFRRMEGKIPKDVVLIYALGALLFGLVASFPLKRVSAFPDVHTPWNHCCPIDLDSAEATPGEVCQL